MKTFNTRKLLITDEAHSVESEILKFVEFRLSEYYLDRLGIIARVPEFNKIEQYVNWITDTRNLILAKIDELNDQIKEVHNYNKEEAKKLIADRDPLTGLEVKMKYFLDSIDDTKWIFDFERSEKLNKKTVVFK